MIIYLLFFLRETVKVFDDLFKEIDIINYYNYDIEYKKLTPINIGKEKILLDFYLQKDVEGEDGFYYVTFKKQLLNNEYTLNSVNINTSEVTSVLKFEMDKRFDNLLIEKLEADIQVVINSRYLITSTNRDSQNTSIIDIKTNKIQTYQRKNTIFDDYLVLF